MCKDQHTQHQGVHPQPPPGGGRKKERDRNARAHKKEREINQCRSVYINYDREERGGLVNR